MKKHLTIPIFIFSILTAIFAVLLFVFFFKVIENKNQHASVVLVTLQEKLKEKEDSIIFSGKVAELKSIQDSINSYFVDSNKIDTFVSYLEGIGLGSVVSVKSIEIPIKTKNTIAIKVSVTGTFKEVMNTITMLENIPYQVNITQIYLNESQKEVVQDNFKVTTKPKVSKISTWQADISFNILSLN